MSANPKSKHDWQPETFPEPRTIPEGWVGDTFEKKPKVAAQAASADDWKPEPFPEPRMFPWDR